LAPKQSIALLSHVEFVVAERDEWLPYRANVRVGCILYGGRSERRRSMRCSENSTTSHLTRCVHCFGC
jgi:hypothetical protein